MIRPGSPAPHHATLPRRASSSTATPTSAAPAPQGARDFLAEFASRHPSPAALHVGCSDSRVLRELLTDSAPGERFVVRNVANRVPPFEDADASVGAALEYAVDVLHVQHVMVCGHTGRGGVKAGGRRRPRPHPLPLRRGSLPRRRRRRGRGR